MAPSEFTKLKLTLSYDGTHYAGWQIQKTGRAVQQVVLEALHRIFPRARGLQGSSRTDAGVHALGFIAQVEIPRADLRMPMAKVRLALNAYLPEDIRIVSASRCSSNFHARFDALGKQYRYLVWNHPAMNPLRRAQSWHVPKALDLERMREASGSLIGMHDFEAFAGVRNYKLKSTIRTLTRLDVRARGPLVTFLMEGDGFLYKMCRTIVGTLVQVGLGKYQAADLAAMLESKDRRIAGMTAPAHGLILWKVYYRLQARHPLARLKSSSLQVRHAVPARLEDEPPSARKS